jgi:two-component system response regulator MprA
MLPKLLGPEVCREIKADKKDLPIIMLTVKPELESKLELFDLGIDDYITKPFLLVELIVRIKAILQRPKICQEKIIKWENITINLNNYSVWVDKKEIYLTKREFSLLRCLITNADRVLSRDEIFDRVWDMNADCFSNTVETHILNLRKKLETKGRKLIHNVSGRGYIIKDKLFHVQG